MASPENSKENDLLPFVVRGLLRAMALLPIEVARSFGRGLGRIYWWLNGRGRRVAERNIALAYPDLSPSEQKKLVLKTVLETGALATEMGHVWLKPWESTRDLIMEVEGESLVREALAAGRGVIVLGPHLGNWEVLGLHLATLGDMVALFEPPKRASIGALIKTARERSGGELVPTTPRGLARLVKSVRSGGISGILPDQVPTDASGGINVPFMGVDCATASLGCNLIQRSGAVAFMGAALRIPGGFRVRYVPAPDALYAEDPEVSLTAMNDAVESLLQGWDNQYQWLYKRFKCHPAGTINHYANL